MSVYVIRAFVKMREDLAANKGSPRFGLLSGNLVLAPATRGAPERAAVGARLAYNPSYSPACMEKAFQGLPCNNCVSAC